jgi:hypothetical protein
MISTRPWLQKEQPQAKPQFKYQNMKVTKRKRKRKSETYSAKTTLPHKVSLSPTTRDLMRFLYNKRRTVNKLS